MLSTTLANYHSASLSIYNFTTSAILLILTKYICGIRDRGLAISFLELYNSNTRKLPLCESVNLHVYHFCQLVKFYKIYIVGFETGVWLFLFWDYIIPTLANYHSARLSIYKFTTSASLLNSTKYICGIWDWGLVNGYFFFGIIHIIPTLFRVRSSVSRIFSHLHLCQEPHQMNEMADKWARKLCNHAFPPPPPPPPPHPDSFLPIERHSVQLDLWCITVELPLLSQLQGWCTPYLTSLPDIRRSL